MKITVDQDKCVASGQCVLAATDVFDQRDDDGIVILRTPNPSPEAADNVREAATLCPAQAILIEE